MKKILFIAGILILINPFVAHSIEVGCNMTVSGYVKNETAVRTHEFDDLLKIEHTAQIEAEYRISDNLHVFGIVREFYDSVFDAEEKYRQNRNLLSRTRGINWLRELYLDFYSTNLDIRIGKQQVVWGTTVGMKILDIVNPDDQREYVLDDFADSRIPLWMLKAEWSPKVNGTLQFLFIPDFKHNFISPAGSPFTYQAVTLGAEKVAALERLGYHVHEHAIRPAKTFENSKIGLRWLDVFKGFEYSLNWLHGYEYSTVKGPSGAILPRVIIPGPSGLPPLGSTMILESKHPQVEYFGGSFTKTFTSGYLRGLTSRGEFVYTHGHKNGYGVEGSQVGIAKVDMWKSALVVEKYVITNWLVEFQYIMMGLTREKEHGYRFLLGPTQGTLDQVETFLTLMVSTDFFYERLKAKTLIVYGDNNDWRFSPRFDFEVTDKINVALGFHFFNGHRNGLNGEFRDNDEVYTEIKFGF
ncbi:MAG: hypothetical protein NTZ51_10120 [Proteobacteria bacterium]|nr:hypothetical protein [Pseudomonadota bacterium]